MTRFKKIAAIAMLGIMSASVLCSCGQEKEEATTVEETTTVEEVTTEADAEAEEASDDSADSEGTTLTESFVTFNGTDVHIGDAYDDIKDKLGDETKPSEKIEPCDGGDYIQIMHYFDGFTLTTLRDEKVIGLELPRDGAGDVAINGKVKKGDTAETVKEALGTPASEDEYSINYNADKANLMIYTENGTVVGAMFMSME